MRKKKPTQNPMLCSPPVNHQGFDAWMKTIVTSAWAVGELGHLARTEEEIRWVLTRMNELEGGWTDG